MKHILIIGAGRSSSSLIRYLLDQLEELDAHLSICDMEIDHLLDQYGTRERLTIFQMNALDPQLREEAVKKADIVVSMLPARFHMEVVRDCLKHKINVITPSYVTDEIKQLDQQAKDNGVLILCELGVDPGIDHMSAMKVIDEIKEQGGVMKCFESFTGGLVAPESDNNPWNYKFTWNPRNVVLAGQGGAAKFIQQGQYKYIPYSRLFRRTELIEIDGYGGFEGYANRDSLTYRQVYGLEEVLTMFRGTLRRVGYCRAWDIFVQLGMTDDSYIVEDSYGMTYRAFLNSFLAYNPSDSVELKLRHYLKIEQDNYVLKKLEFLDFFSEKKIEVERGTPAQILQHILEQKWQLDADDKDMLVMWHRFVYELEGVEKELHSSMVHIGENQVYTAMSNTVGLPLGIATKLILQGKLPQTGVHLPIEKTLYEPCLQELKQHGIDFIEKEVEPSHY